MTKNDHDFLVNNIRSQYIEREPSRLDELKKLDRKVKRPAKIFGYVFGTVGALVMGSGMSLIMTDIGQTLGLHGDLTAAAVAIGVLGMVMAAVNYPICKKILAHRKQRYGAQVLKLSAEIMRG